MLHSILYYPSLFNSTRFDSIYYVKDTEGKKKMTFNLTHLCWYNIYIYMLYSKV